MGFKSTFTRVRGGDNINPELVSGISWGIGDGWGKDQSRFSKPHFLVYRDGIYYIPTLGDGVRDMTPDQPPLVALTCLHILRFGHVGRDI